jgi:hypothetical protein
MQTLVLIVGGLCVLGLGLSAVGVHATLEIITGLVF